MRIGELAHQAGVSVPTIKYYVREGMLAPGDRQGPNLVRYAPTHLRRLRLIRAMLEIGTMSIAAVRDVLCEIDAVGHAVDAVIPADPDPDPLFDDPDPLFDGVDPLFDGVPAVGRPSAAQEVDELLRRHGWAAAAESEPDPGRQVLVRIVSTYRALGQVELLGLLDRYATAASELAAAESATVNRLTCGVARVEAAVLGAVLGDAAMSAMRRIALDAAAQEHDATQVDAARVDAARVDAVVR